MQISFYKTILLETETLAIKTLVTFLSKHLAMENEINGSKVNLTLIKI